MVRGMDGATTAPDVTSLGIHSVSLPLDQHVNGPTAFRLGGIAFGRMERSITQDNHALRGKINASDCCYDVNISNSGTLG